MRFVATLAIVIATTASSSVLSAQNAPIQHGRWEISMTMDMPGMPANMPPIKTTQCVTKEQANDPAQAVPKGPDGSDCKVIDHKVVGNKVSWTMKCTGEAAMSGEGEITYGTDTYDGWMKMTTAQGAMAVKYTAKRLGDCTK